jgi:hypothetical protein
VLACRQTRPSALPSSRQCVAVALQGWWHHPHQQRCSKDTSWQLTQWCRADLVRAWGWQGQARVQVTCRLLLFRRGSSFLLLRQPALRLGGPHLQPAWLQVGGCRHNHVVGTGHPACRPCRSCPAAALPQSGAGPPPQGQEACCRCTQCLLCCSWRHRPAAACARLNLLLFVAHGCAAPFSCFCVPL